MILDGKKLADNICLDLKQRCDVLKANGVEPVLTIVTSGDDAASKVYVRNKLRRCEEIGIKPDVHHFDFLYTHQLNAALLKTTNPIIVQEPITGYVDHQTVSSLMDPSVDVDGFSYDNIAKLAMGYHPQYYPCTPKGVMRLLHEYNVPIEGQDVLVIGRSNIVGRPMAMMLEQENATVTVVHRKTPIYDILRAWTRADIIVSATGHYNAPYLGALMDWSGEVLLNDQIIVDVGMNRDENGKLCGDIPEALKQKCAFYTPTPGGTGPMTVAMLMENVIEHYEREMWL